MEREAMIRQRAHLLWEAEGRPQGRDVAHWLHAERELSAGGRQRPAPAIVQRRPRHPAGPRRHWCVLDR
ncbi:DUF2934 domain-containing protein [Arenibaculum pallidiluteum]|uniref:DUF2934 domain-containing protein n=1 Tax=Arenibaculum pallidiluteum TaxID=2812559 RepID=UPI001F2B95A0|nr:DUF2934 domain-containing protein [Arenibaculum pallidiluteum]